MFNADPWVYPRVASRVDARHPGSLDQLHPKGAVHHPLPRTERTLRKDLVNRYLIVM